MGNGEISFAYLYNAVASVTQSPRIYCAYTGQRVCFGKRNVSVSVKSDVSSYVCCLIEKSASAEAHVKAVAVTCHKGHTINVLVGDVLKGRGVIVVASDTDEASVLKALLEKNKFSFSVAEKKDGRTVAFLFKHLQGEVFSAVGVAEYENFHS